MAPRVDEAGTRPLSFRIGPALQARLDALQIAEDRGQSDMARRVFEAGLTAYEARLLRPVPEQETGT